MSGAKLAGERRFWDAILCLARLQRSRKTTDFQTARAALEVEEMATERLKLLQDEEAAELGEPVPAGQVVVAGQSGTSTQGP